MPGLTSFRICYMRGSRGCVTGTCRLMIPTVGLLFVFIVVADKASHFVTSIVVSGPRTETRRCHCSLPSSSTAE